MSNVNDVKQLVRDLDAETNAQAAKVDAAIASLRNQVAAGGTVSQADIDEIASGLASVSARLKTLGSDSSDPIPSPADPPQPGTAAYDRAHDGK